MLFLKKVDLAGETISSSSSAITTCSQCLVSQQRLEKKAA